MSTTRDGINLRREAGVLVTIPPVTVSSVLAIAITLLTAAYLWLPPANQQLLLFFAACCAAAGQLAVALYTARILQLAMDTQVATAKAVTERENKTEDRLLFDTAQRFGERWTDASMVHLRTQCQELIDNRDKPAEIRKLLEANTAMQTNVGNMLNFLEQLALSVRERRCDEVFAKRLFCGIVTNMWHATESWVKEQRAKRGRSQLWAELEFLYNCWR
jgi:hypothetical protein